ncbi:AraC family transcriptional regulator ligand-binding domain-containing protein, partial [Escherichia coli]|uniref:AraC family transcriptional regulator ligand-binding domain-containing protein n=1 Tax=Escherichia coli TaxID=562 RepID=UPI003C6CF5FF
MQLKDRNVRLTQREFARFVRILTRVTRDEFWGLCSRRVKLGTFRTLCRNLLHCRDLGESLREGAR